MHALSQARAAPAAVHAGELAALMLQPKSRVWRRWPQGVHSAAAAAHRHARLEGSSRYKEGWWILGEPLLLKPGHPLRCRHPGCACDRMAALLGAPVTLMRACIATRLLATLSVSSRLRIAAHHFANCIRGQMSFWLHAQIWLHAGGKRSGRDYSAESTAVREMFEETSGAVCSGLLPCS